MKTYIYGLAKFSDGTEKTSRDFVNYSAFSNWANAQFRKDEGVTIEEYHWKWVGSKIDIKKVCTWHA